MDIIKKTLQVFIANKIKQKLQTSTWGIHWKPYSAVRMKKNKIEEIFKIYKEC